MHTKTPKLLPESYTAILRDILNQRVLKNETYSLRAFARDLNLNPGFLSDILTKRANLSLKKSVEVASQLFESMEDQKFFCKLVEIANSKNDQKAELEKQVYNFDSAYITISPEAYAPIADWHSMAFLELMCTKDFKYDLQWIARKLAITENEVEETIETLLANKLICIENNVLKKQYNYLALPNGNKSSSAKDFHKHVLNKGVHALDEQSSETRNFSAAFLHINSADVQKISERIKNFRRELAHDFESEETADSVYMFSIQLFRADTIES